MFLYWIHVILASAVVVLAAFGMRRGTIYREPPFLALGFGLLGFALVLKQFEYGIFAGILMDVFALGWIVILRSKLVRNTREQLKRSAMMHLSASQSKIGLFDKRGGAGPLSTLGGALAFGIYALFFIATLPTTLW